jgi:hypothetical protein
MSKIVKLQGKIFGINLNWFEFDSKKTLESQAKLLKCNYGYSYTRTVVNTDGFKVKKILTCLTDKSLSSYYSLAAIVANELQSGIFITDKLNIQNNNDIVSKQYWVCIFQNREVIANIEIPSKQRNIKINGDQLLREEELLGLIDAYTQEYKVSIYADLIDEQALNIPRLKLRVLEKLVDGRIPSKYIIRKLHSHNRQYIMASALILVFGIAWLSYNKIDTQKTVKPVLHKTQKKSNQEVLVLKNIQTNSASLILNSLNRLLSILPVMIAGWKIDNLTFIDGSVQIQYLKELGNIADARVKASEYIRQYEFIDSSIKFSKNDEVMQLSFKLNSIEMPLLKSLTEKDIKENINTNQAIETIAEIQNNFLNYRLEQMAILNHDYSSQQLSINNIRPIDFERLISVSNKNGNLVVKSLQGKFNNNFGSSWSFKGAIYE